MNGGQGARQPTPTIAAAPRLEKGARLWHSQRICGRCRTIIFWDEAPASKTTLACLLALAIAAVAVWCSLLYINHGSFGFRCGLLDAANEPYLDGSGKAFQKGSWHLGNGTHIRGETYGFKVHRLYVSMEVGHTNP